MPLPSDPITAVADAVAVLVDDIAKPLLNPNQAQAHDNEFRDLCQQINDAFTASDPARARALGALASRLCIDNGYPTVGLGDDIVEVPLDHLEALLTIAAARLRDSEKLNDLLHTLQTK